MCVCVCVCVCVTHEERAGSLDGTNVHRILNRTGFKNLFPFGRRELGVSHYLINVCVCVCVCVFLCACVCVILQNNLK